MNKAHPLTSSITSPISSSIIAWLVGLFVSDLSSALWQAWFGTNPAWLLWVKIGMLLVLVVLSWKWGALKPLGSFFLLLLILRLGLSTIVWIRGIPGYHAWESQAGWVLGNTSLLLMKLILVLVMASTLLLLGKRRDQFYLTKGDLHAPVSPFFGKAGPASRQLTWGRLGLVLGLGIAPLTFLFFALGGLPSSSALVDGLPLIPAAIIFAAINAFCEEMQFRASLLGPLHETIGDDQAIWLTAIFFGSMHYFEGGPSGVPGVIIASLLGALFAKSMLETRGLLVPWFIHFCQNMVIYSIWAF